MTVNEVCGDEVGRMSPIEDATNNGEVMIKKAHSELANSENKYKASAVALV